MLLLPCFNVKLLSKHTKCCLRQTIFFSNFLGEDTPRQLNKLMPLGSLISPHNANTQKTEVHKGRTREFVY